MSKPTVLLASIVKNEAHIIERMLDSALPWVDSFFIIDTGSTDDTISKIMAWADRNEMPGMVAEEDWINFEHNRSSLVRQAREMGYDYLLLADADQVFAGDEGALDNLTDQAYMIRMAGDFEWWMPYLVSSSPHWEYKGVTHEFLTCPEPFVSEKLHGFVIHHHGDGGTRPEKLERDHALLIEEFAKNPGDDRTTFYLAQTEKDMGNTERALELYEHRVSLGGWDEEVYWAMYQVALLSNKTDDWLRAWNFRPTRPEALLGLMRIHNDLGNHTFVYSIGQWYLDHYQRSDDHLFIERDGEQWGVELQYAVAAFWAGHPIKAKHKFEELLTRDIPDSIRELVEKNLTYC